MTYDNESKHCCHGSCAEVSERFYNVNGQNKSGQFNLHYKTASSHRSITAICVCALVKYVTNLNY